MTNLLTKRMVFIGSRQVDFTPDNSNTRYTYTVLSVVDPTQSQSASDKHGLVVSEVRADFNFFAETEKLKPLAAYDFQLDFIMDGKKTTPFIRGFSPVKN